MRGLYLMLLTACVLVLSSGPVSAAGEELGTVEGIVSYNGKPLKDAKITFHLNDDQFVGAKVKDGKYRVDRVPVGAVKVTVESKTVRLPVMYTSDKTTPLTVEIKKGKGTVDFELHN